MSRTNRNGTYLPRINGSIDVQEIVDVLSFAAVDAIRNIGEKSFVDMYSSVVRVDGYENDTYDALVQHIADVVDSSQAWDDEDFINEIALQAVLGLAAEYVTAIPRLENLLTAEELDIALTVLAELDHTRDQLDRSSRRGRGGDRRRSRDTRSRDPRSRDARSRDTRRPQRTAYNAGRYDDYRHEDERPSSRDNRNRRGSRDNRRDSFNYRGNNRDSGQSLSRNGRQPPMDDQYDDFPDNRRDSNQLTTKERLRRENTRTPQAVTQIDETRGNKVPVGGRTDVSRTSSILDTSRRADPARQVNSEETSHELEDGRTVILIPATRVNMKSKKSPYRVLPVFPSTANGFFTLTSNGDITGVIGLPKTDEEMDKQRHDVSRFFKTWGRKDKLPDHKATAKALGDIQATAWVNQMEKEIEEKYGLDDIETIPEIDIDNLYVAKSITTYEAHEDFVGTGQAILMGDIEHQNMKDKFGEVITQVPINYSAIEFCGFSLTGAAATKALELQGLSSFSAIKNKLYELEPLVSSAILFELDQIATKWVNDLVARKFGIINWSIDSFLSDIEDLVLELAKDFSLTVELTAQASGLVETVLRPLTNRDADVCQLTGLTKDAELTVKFGRLSSITLLQLDSDELALYMKNESGSVTYDSWASMALALQVFDTLSKPNTAEMLLVTRDNRKIYVEHGSLKGEYILSR